MEPPCPCEAPAMDPARAAYLRSTLARLSAYLISALLADPGSAASTGSGSLLSLQERLLVQAMGALLPRIRGTLMTRLSEADPVALEHYLGAAALALESILEQAPGEPLPRQALVAGPDGRLELRPLAELA